MNDTKSKPQLVMIAGPNGAGKTSAAMELLPDFLRIHEFVNADEIARGLSPLNPSGSAIEAGRLMLRRIRQLVEKKSKVLHLKPLLQAMDICAHLHCVSRQDTTLKSSFLLCKRQNLQ